MRNQEVTALGSALVVLGIIFGVKNQWIGYSFMGAGVLLSIIHAFKSKKPKTQSHRTGGA